MVIYGVSALTLLGSSAIAPVLPVMMQDLALTQGEVGWLMTAYTLPVIVAVPVVGWLADHLGRRAVLLPGLFTFGLAGVAVFFTTDLSVILGLRVLQGVGYSAISPVTIALLGDLFEGEAGAGAQGLRVVSLNLGGFAFPIASGVLAGIAWNLPFLLFALAIPAGVAVAVGLPEPETAQRADPGSVREALRAARAPVVAGTLLLGFVRFFVSYGVVTFLPLLAVERGVSVGATGAVIGAISGVKVLVATQARRSFGVGRPTVTMGAAMVLSAALVAAFLLADGVTAFVVVAAAYGVSEGVIAPLQKTVLTQAVTADVRTSVVSFNAVLKSAGKTAAPVTLGYLVADSGLAAGFRWLGAGGVVAAFVVLMVFVRAESGAHARATEL